MRSIYTYDWVDKEANDLIYSEIQDMLVKKENRTGI